MIIVKGSSPRASAGRTSSVTDIACSSSADHRRAPGRIPNDRDADGTDPGQLPHHALDAPRDAVAERTTRGGEGHGHGYFPVVDHDVMNQAELDDALSQLRV